MYKIIAIVAVLLCVFFAVLHAQPAKTQKPSGSFEEQVLQKLDEILQNQEEQFDYLKFIKNRSR